MKFEIDLYKNSDFVLIRDLPVGTIFKTDRWSYLRINDTTTESGYAPALELSDGFKPLYNKITFSSSTKIMKRDIIGNLVICE